MNIQRYLIHDKTNNTIIGTDSLRPFTEKAANQKLAILQAARPKNEYVVLEINPLVATL